MANGSVQEVTIDSRRLAVAADADITIKLGGFEVEVQPNGDGLMRKKLMRVPFKIDAGQYDSGEGGQEFLQSKANAPGFFPITITLVDGRVYQGVGTPSGEIAYSSQNGTVSAAFEGQAELVSQ